MNISPTRRPRRHWRPAPGLVWLAGLWLAAGGGLVAWAAPPPDYAVKAAFLLNFGKFTTWPEHEFAGRQSPLVIGVLGDDPFHGALKTMISGRAIDGHPLVFRALDSAARAAGCQIVFVSQAAQAAAVAGLPALQAAHVLTVTENLARLAGSGFTINFVTVQDHVRFEINRPAAARAGLAISSKLLSLALPPES